MYKLADDKFGIRITTVGGLNNERRMMISWSPILQLNETKKEVVFEPITSNIEYKVYLGYNNQTLDLFSSLCMLEAADEFSKTSHNLRLLENQGYSKSEFEFLSPDIYVLKSDGANSSVVVRGNDAFKNLKNAVVMAHVYRKGAEPIALVYAPISFDEVLDYD